jgi:hypothetical protein
MWKLEILWNLQVTPKRWCDKYTLKHRYLHCLLPLLSSDPILYYYPTTIHIPSITARHRTQLHEMLYVELYINCRLWDKKNTTVKFSEKYAVSVSIGARDFAERSSIACRYVFKNEKLKTKEYILISRIFLFPVFPRLSLCHLLTKQKRNRLSPKPFRRDHSTTHALWSSRN